MYGFIRQSFLAIFLTLTLFQDRVSLGLYRPDCTITTNTPSELAILTEFHDILEKGGSTVKIVPEIQRMKFSKNFWNIAFSSFATLVGYRLPAIFRSPPKDGDDYEPYVCETTRNRVEEYTIPNVRAVLEEVLILGMLSTSFVL
jgi:2-dehydropantoate 2-reductase